MPSRWAVLFLTIVATIAAGPPAWAQTVVPDSTLTGGQLIARLRATAADIAAMACPVSRDQATPAVSDLVALADRLEVVFANEPDAPLEMREGRPDESAGRGIAALTVAEAFVRATRGCAGEDFGLLVDALRQNVQRAAGDADSWSSGRSRILRVRDGDGGAVIGLRAGAPSTLILEGWNLDSHSCGTVEASLARAGGESVAAVATSVSDGGIAVTLPPLDEPGLYDLSVRLPRRRFLFFCGSTRSSFTVPVHTATPFGVRYTVSTTTSERRTITWNAGELKRANESCDQDRLAGAVFRLPDGWTYESHEWIVFLNNGAVKRAEAVRGNEVQLEYRIPRKAGPFCTGESRLIHGQMVIQGSRTHTGQGPAIDGGVRGAMAPGERMAVPIPVEAPEGTAIAEWTVDVRFLYPDGSERRVPLSSGAGPLTGSEPGGGSFTWDPESRRLTFSAPAMVCGPASERGAAGKSR